jgi:ATP-binding cassette subfamily B protein
MVWESGRGVVIGALASRALLAILPVSMLAVSKLIFDAVQVRFAGAPLRRDFWWLVGLECGLAIVGASLGRAAGFFDALLADRFTRYISVRVMNHASRLDLATYENPAFHDKLERARVQATDRIAMVQAIGSLLQQFVAMATLSLTILYFSPWLLALLIAATLPALLGESHFAFLGYSLNIRQTPIRRRLDYLRVLGASKESAKELKLFGLSPWLSGEYARLSDDLYEQNQMLAKRRLLIGMVLSSISTGSYYAAYALVIYRTVSGGLSWGTLQMLAGALAGTSNAIQSVFVTASSVADQSLFLTDLVNFFAIGPQIQSVPGARPLPRPIRDGIVFEQVTFSYPGSDRRVLDRLDLRLAPGERIALVGGNGEGKTTIVKLLARLYDPTAGSILIDGVDLREYQVEDLQGQIGIIFQDFVRYDLTARDNIAVGRVELAHSDRHIELAARKSLADSVIVRLPRGYQQMLGRRFEGGVDLSGGEWQKMALGRAYLRDAQLLVLDEPTASLDAVSEYQVFERFADLTAGRMALLISHRFSTVRMADRIVVLSQGAISEQGSHLELLRSGGQYARMFELQAAGYR